MTIYKAVITTDPFLFLTYDPRWSVFSDPNKHGAWWNARQAWLAGIESGADHVLVMHDDMKVTPTFERDLERVVAAAPFDVIQLFSNLKMPNPNKYSWLEMSTHCAGGCVVMPRALADEFVEWCDDNVSEHWKADDTRIAVWSCATSEPLFATVPSLVQHLGRPDLVAEKVGEWKPGGLTLTIPGGRANFLTSRAHYLYEPLGKVKR